MGQLSLKLKRLIDIIGAILGLAVLSPIIVLISALVCLTMGLPVFFLQVRIGYRCKPFLIYKFRTMTEDKDENGKLLPDERRLTRFGKFLRTTSLDELPELFNVLKGDMSLVGPRPLPPEYLPYYTEEEMRRHDVKPGITGWAQINGRNAISWDQKLALDVWYVDNWSLLLDFKILLITLAKVIKCEGVSAKGYATSPRLDEIRGRVMKN
ncbi:MAG: sugar transferase [Armatimonadetes bacterium]|nr:sugar transferase [Armatimonadota bacterium]